MFVCVFVVKACILLFVRCEVVTNIMGEHSIQNASQNVWLSLLGGKNFDVEHV